MCPLLRETLQCLLKLYTKHNPCLLLRTLLPLSLLLLSFLLPSLLVIIRLRALLLRSVVASVSWDNAVTMMILLVHVLVEKSDRDVMQCTCRTLHATSLPSHRMQLNPLLAPELHPMLRLPYQMRGANS
jgi:hypothetical protein